jgi:cyclophilin family peptidyl-prolyl cis-trans isomerase
VSFAKTSRPNSRTSNIFVNTLNNTYLDEYDFVPFGQVDEEGMAVVERMYAGYGGNVPQNYIR